MTHSKEREFLNFVRTYYGGYTDFSNIRMWLESSRILNKCQSVAYLKMYMRIDSYFTKRHFAKLDAAEKFYFANKHLFV